MGIMTLSELLLHPAFVGLVVAFPSLALGYVGYRRSVKADTAVEQTGVLAIQSQTVRQVIDGLNLLVTNLQTDNTALRVQVKHLDERLTAVIAECQELRVQIAELRLVGDRS